MVHLVRDPRGKLYSLMRNTWNPWCFKGVEGKDCKNRNATNICTTMLDDMRVGERLPTYRWG